MEFIPSVDLFNDPRYTQFRESWCAALFGVRFSKHFAPCEVMINDDDNRLDADFYVMIAERVHDFQLAEVQEPGRRRGLEYRQVADGTVQTIPYLPERGRIHGPVWIANGISAKVAKSYAGAKELNLLLYANFSAGALEYEAVRKVAADNVEAFASVWVITSLCLGCIYSDGRFVRPSGWMQIRPIEDYYVDRHA